MQCFVGGSRKENWIFFSLPKKPKMFTRGRCIVLVFWFWREKFLVLRTYSVYKWREIVLKMRTPFEFLLGYFIMIRQRMCIFHKTWHSFTLYLSILYISLVRADPQVEVQIRILFKNKYVKSCQNTNTSNHTLISWTMLIGFLYFRETLWGQSCGKRLYGSTTLQSR